MEILILWRECVEIKYKSSAMKEDTNVELIVKKRRQKIVIEEICERKYTTEGKVTTSYIFRCQGSLLGGRDQMTTEILARFKSSARCNTPTMYDGIFVAGMCLRLSSAPPSMEGMDTQTHFPATYLLHRLLFSFPSYESYFFGGVEAELGANSIVRSKRGGKIKVRMLLITNDTIRNWGKRMRGARIPEDSNIWTERIKVIRRRMHPGRRR